jgi:hypothetical protein
MERGPYKPDAKMSVILEILDDYVFEPPREFTLKQFKQEASRRGLKYSEELYNLIEGELISFEEQGLLKRTGEGDNAKYVPKFLINKKKK